MDDPLLNQNAYAIWTANVDGTSTTAPDLVTEQTSNATHSIDKGTQIAVGFVLQEVAGFIAANVRPQLQYDKNTTGFLNVDGVSSNVQSINNTATADAANTADVLGGTGTFIGATAFDDVNGQSGGAALDIAASGHTESRHEVILVDADLTAGDSIVLRIVDNATALNAYNASPTIDVTGVSGDVIFSDLHNIELGIVANTAARMAGILES